MISTRSSMLPAGASSSTISREAANGQMQVNYLEEIMQQIEFNENQKVHFIGIGGISMSGIAQVLLSRGIKVSGSDSKASELTAQLEHEGAKVFIGQSGDNLMPDVSLVVYTAAIAQDNPELQQARKRGIPCMSRAEFLGALMKNYETAVCIAGTHGKTTTTSMLSQIMVDADTDPTIMVGGILPLIHGNTRIGASETFITEACEYTNSFLEFFPTVSVILNVKEDHVDFFKDLADIRHSFRKFAQQTSPGGTLVINGEIDDLSYFTEDLPCKVVTFGMSSSCFCRAEHVTFRDDACTEFDVSAGQKYLGHVVLHVPGEHNIYNALAAICTAVAIGVDAAAACALIGGFHGVDRRLQYKGSIGGVTVIDDYAHHPDEIEATLKAVQKIPHKKLWVVFQPHTYSRTEAFMDAFAEKLSMADAVILAEIFAAREKNVNGISSAQLADKLRERGTECYYFPTFDEIENFLLQNCESGDMFITMGAGDVVLIGDKVLGL